MKTKRVKKLSAKSRLLLEKGAACLCDIYYLMLNSEWYIKNSNHIYRFKLNPKVTNINFGIQKKKQLGMDKSTRHILNFLEKVLILKEKL